ncbi:MAG: sugar ABC transporter permease [Clostridia bacterium]|nr:sugar ABC transporter permease [Clostridia bacterium]
MNGNLKALSFKEKMKYQLDLAKKNYDCYLFLAPFGLLFIAFVVMPVFISIFFGFTDYNLLEAPGFVGLQNYQKLLVNDEIFTQAFRNTMIIAVVVGPLGYFASLMIAWQINELNNVLRAIMVTIMYAPSISGGAIVIWQYIFSNDSYGYINSFLMSWGFIQEPIQFLSDTKYMLTIVIIVMVWMSLGAGFLSFVAGLKTVDKSQYEAGYIDGINSRWQELWFITLPSMKPQLMFGAVMSITNAFSAGAVSTQMFGSPSTDYAAHTIINHLEDYGGVRFELGYACTIATVLFVMMIAINEIIQRLLNKVGS